MLLLKLMESPVASENSCNACLSLVASSVHPRTRMIVSSAYCNIGHGPCTRGCRMPPSALTSFCRISAMSRNKYGDRVYPRRRPRRQDNQGPGMPFTRTAERELTSSHRIQLRQSTGKPRASSTRSRLSQLTESNAFAKSSLTTRVGAFLL